MGHPKLGPVIAIDGPAGAGKSSVTKRLAQELGYVHIDTGALYRSIAYAAMDRGDLTQKMIRDRVIPSPEDERIAILAREAHLEFKRDPERNPSNRVFINGADVTDRIRSPEVSMGASLVSAIPGVRAALLGLQRQLGCAGKAILEGRDIGTVVFPDADVKIFLTASIDERARRRLIELEAVGADSPGFEEVRAQVVQRDAGDTNRIAAPLKRASDAIEFDTSGLSLEEVVKRLVTLVHARVGV